MIYQIMIDRFNGGWTTPPKNGNAFLGGTLKGITEKLDYIQSLGASAVWLSPFLKTESYHGYHITNYEEVEPRFGTWDDLRELIEKAHAKGMKVIADYVPNHCHVNHPFFQEAAHNTTSQYRKWFYFKGDGPSDYKCFLFYDILPKFNLEYRPAAEYMLGIAEKMIRIGIDGLRVDHALGIPVPFLKELCERVHNINPQAFVFGEVWPFGVPRKYFNTLRFKSTLHKLFYYIFGIGQESIQLDYENVLDGILDFEFRNIMLDEIKSGKGAANNPSLKKRLNKHFAKYRNGKLVPVLFLDNHDTDRILFDCNHNKDILKDAIEIMKEHKMPYVIYYGTECSMSNNSTIFNAEPYADLRVREAMEWK